MKTKFVSLNQDAFEQSIVVEQDDNNSQESSKMS